MKQAIKKIKQKKSVKMFVVCALVFLGFLAEKVHLEKLVVKLAGIPVAQADSAESGSSGGGDCFDHDCANTDGNDCASGDCGEGGADGGDGSE